MMAAAQLARRLAYPLHFHVFAGRGRVYEGGFCESGFAYVVNNLSSDTLLRLSNSEFRDSGTGPWRWAHLRDIQPTRG